MGRSWTRPATAASRSRTRFASVVGREPERVDYAGRTDHQIALSMLNGSHEQLPEVLEGLAAKLAAREDAIARRVTSTPASARRSPRCTRRDGRRAVALTGNVEPNAAVKVGAFGLERWLDLEAGAYGSDPHERRSDLVAVARERAAARYGEPTGAVLVGDTPLDVLAAREAGARAVAVATGFADLESLRASEPDALLQDLSDTEAAIRASLLPLDAAADRLGLRPGHVLGGAQAVERVAQPARRRGSGPGGRRPARRDSAAARPRRPRTRRASSWRRTRAPRPATRRAGRASASPLAPRARASPRASRAG